MSGYPQQLAFQHVATYRQLLLHQLYESPHVLSFDPVAMELVTWYWPVNGHKLVPPSNLRDYRDHHQFLGPSCLCPLLGPLEETLVFKEAAIYMPVFGPYAGEHVAECRESRCGYLVSLEQTYTKPKVPAKAFPRRDTFTACPSPVHHQWELQSRRTLKRTYAVSNFKENSPPEDLFFNLGHQTDWHKFVKLDAMDRAGLTEVDFFGLFVKCEGCKLVMTRQVFVALKHRCVPKVLDSFELHDME